SQIEPKWQKKWEETDLYSIDLTKPDKFYCLAEFAYPSGDLHMGHWFTFGGADIFARTKRMQGLNVFFPNGFDAFGLPAENAAIKRGIHPKTWTNENIKTMKKQFASMGGSYEWGHQVITCDPEYYRWNQWIFLRMLKRGIAYRGKALVNWCPFDQTVLADEQVVVGQCDRCGNAVIQKEVEQWFLKITQYAERLIWPDKPTINWPQAVREGQNNWIGKSEGIEIEFRIKNLESRIKVYTVFPETIFGVTFMVLAPEHPLVSQLIKPEYKIEADQYTKEAQKKSAVERMSEEKHKTGVFTGSYCINPANGKEIPVWIADYVIASYGTGAVMGVPGSDHRDFEFAKKYGLEIIKVISKSASDKSEIVTENDVLEAGFIVNSGQFDGLETPLSARDKIKDWMEEEGFGKRKVNYHLHDWSVSRQRYWGTPIPIIHCDKCGIVPVPDEDLPVELPADVDFTPKGEPPLATAKAWVAVKCPKCKGEARRDTETLDGFFDNSWYFFRYLDPKNSKEIFSKKIVEKWIPVDIYFGGAEHTLGHTLYSRFFTEFFKDIDLIGVDEYALRRINHGIVLGTDNEKMSKSRGNVVDPDKEVKKYGADTIRIYVAFFMPYDATGPWVPERIWGPYRFLQRVWGLQEKVATAEDGRQKTEDLRMMHKTIKKVTEDIEQIKFNTAIAALMEWLNHLSRKEKIAKEEYKTFLLLLAPFAPHTTEELWQVVESSVVSRQSSDNANLKADSEASLKTDSWSIHKQSWPKSDNKYLENEEVSIAVQIDGKVRDILVIGKDIVNNKEVVEKMAYECKKAQKFLEGKFVKKTVYIQGKIISFVVSN
ncbi:MAG: leucine--tRNA ligase, partial [Patescibacteria group bacterium]